VSPAVGRPDIFTNRSLKYLFHLPFGVRNDLVFS
jgi:hypothetical protein